MRSVRMIWRRGRAAEMERIRAVSAEITAENLALKRGDLTLDSLAVALDRGIG